MRRYTICMFVLCLSLWVGYAAAQDQDKAVATAAENWLSLIDAGNYSKSWREAAEYFRNAVSEEKWVHSLKAVRSPLGRLINRKVKSMSYATSLPGAPDGEYAVIQFETSFEYKQAAIETVTPMFENGAWRVSGYYIK